MKRFYQSFIYFFVILLSACAVKNPINNQYKLECFAQKRVMHATPYSVLVTPPEAAANYQTEQMLYVNKPYRLAAFVHNAWRSAPANMLFPLIIQSLQYSGYFHSVSATPYSDKADYRIDTQLLALEQNFLVKPSYIELAVKVVLTHIDDNRILASTIMHQRVPCPEDTPYGGVIAANQAVKIFTQKLVDFVLDHIQTEQKI